MFYKSLKVRNEYRFQAESSIPNNPKNPLKTHQKFIYMHICYVFTS